MSASRDVIAETIANAVVDSTVDFGGNFLDFLYMLKSPEQEVMTQHEDFNPVMRIERTDDGAVEGEEEEKDGSKGKMKFKLDDKLTIKFVSGVADKWNYKAEMTQREFLKWKLRAKREAQFTAS